MTIAKVRSLLFVYIKTKETKNKYGGNTYRIDLDSFMRLFLLETNTETIIVELKEKRIFKTKTYFSFYYSSQKV